MMYNMPHGRYRWLILSFSLSVSSDVFWERLDAGIKALPGVTGMADDVLAKEDSEINHIVAVLSLLETT